MVISIGSLKTKKIPKLTDKKGTSNGKLKPWWMKMENY
jgi:hypothetical protein